MKKFEFQLGSALDWRKRRMEAEQTRLESLETQRAQLHASLNHVEQTWTTAQASIRNDKVIRAEELEALENYRQAANWQRQQLGGQIRQLSKQIEEQRTRVVEATRQYRLIEKLRDRRFDEWQRGVDAQLEQEAGELYLAQWMNQD